MARCKKCKKEDTQGSPSGFCHECWLDVGGPVYGWDKIKKCKKCGEWKNMEDEGVCSDCVIDEGISNYNFE